MDIGMPSMSGGATETLIEALPDAKALIFGMRSTEFVTSAMQVGAVGYILKDTGSEEFTLALKA